jgi:dTDP-4-dehydrorhamnose 3,5-epimerase
MRFTQTEIPGVVIVDIEPHRDERGYFAQSFSSEEFAAHGLFASPVQCATSFNPRRGTLRGLHFQSAPHAQAKLVRCTRGMIYDVVVDLRRDLPSHGSWIGIALSQENGRALHVPEGCAHGFQTLEPSSEVLYLMGGAYRPQSAGGVRWNDPAFGIAWPLASPHINERDATYPEYRR